MNRNIQKAIAVLLFLALLLPVGVLAVNYDSTYESYNIDYDIEPPKTRGVETDDISYITNSPAKHWSHCK